MNALRRWWPDLLIVIGVTWLAFACSAYAGDGSIEGELDQGGGDVAGDISIGKPNASVSRSLRPPR